MTLPKLWRTKNNVFEVEIPNVKLEGASIVGFLYQSVPEYQACLKW